MSAPMTTPKNPPLRDALECLDEAQTSIMAARSALQGTGWIDKIVAETPSDAILIPPPIGTLWDAMGGIYAGICRGEAGQPQRHVVVAAGALGELTGEWGPRGMDVPGATNRYDGLANTAAMAKAGSALARKVLALRIGGHADWHIPSVAEGSLCLANAPELFAKSWHWTSTQTSAYDAFVQYFEYGYSYANRKVSEFRVRALRGFTLQPFNPSTLSEGGAR